MDDKLINLIVTVVVIGIWAAQFFLKPKPKDDERHFDEDDEDEQFSEAQRNTYAEDPYIKVQEEIRRKIAERQAAEQAASQTGRSTKQAQQPARPLVAQAEPRASVKKEMQPSQRQVQSAPVAQPAARPAQQPSLSIDEIRRRRELAEQRQQWQGNVKVDRELRNIPQAQLPNRAFPTTQAPTQKAAFPAAARSSQAAYHGSTKLRREANPRNVALKAALRSSGSTRQAVLLREILDKPLGLR